MTITVERTGAAQDIATVTYYTADAWAVGVEDYQPVSGTLTFAVGERSKTVTVSVTDNTFYEGGVYLVLGLHNASAGYTADDERSWTTLLLDENEAEPDEEGSPVADPDYFYANFTQGGTWQLATGDSVLTNDFDYYDEPLTITAYTAPAQGSLTFDTATGRFTYTPPSGFTGEARFTYTLSNGTKTAKAIVTLAHSDLLDPACRVFAQAPKPAAPAVGTWTVTRWAEDDWAKVKTTAAGTDTFEMLANAVGLEKSQVAKWLSWEDPHRAKTLTQAQNNAIIAALADPTKKVNQVFANQTEFWVPNKVLAYWGGDVSQIGRHWVRWKADLHALINKGYKVVYAGYAPKTQVVVTYNNPTLAANNPQEYWRRYHRMVADAQYRATQAGGTKESPWTKATFNANMEKWTGEKSLIGVYFWGHGFPPTKVKNQGDQPGGLVLNSKLKTAEDWDQYAISYSEWKAKVAYNLGAGSLFGCYTGNA